MAWSDSTIKEVIIMGRFARSNNVSKARAQVVEPRASVRSWTNKKPLTSARMDKRSKLEQRIFKISLAVVLIILGGASGWLTGEFFVGPARDKVTDSATVVGSLQQSHTEDPVLDQTKQAATIDHAKSDEHQADASTGRAVKADGARHHAKGGSFEPTSIVTKPVKVISKPIKKLNPLKLF